MFHRLHIVVTGRVQGVGFRYFTQSRARAFGLSGYVWNRNDGAVEVEAEGAKGALESFLSEVERGPGGAAVEEARATWSEGPARHERFRIR